MSQAIKRKRGTLALTVTILSLTALLTLFGKTLMEERLSQMEQSLENVSLQKNRDRTFLISSKITLLKQRMARPRETKKDFVDEYKAQRLATLDSRALDKIKQANSTTIITPLIQTIRLLMGKKATPQSKATRRDPLLEKAYLLELQRDYLKAAIFFKKTLDSGRYSKTLVEDYIRLHIGFCLTMNGQFSESRKHYARLLEHGKKTELRSLALQLMDFSIMSETRISSIFDNKDSLLGKAEEHLRFHNIPEALRLVQQHLTKQTSEKDRALYIKGRCLEERGQIQAAILAYADVLLLDLDSYWARLANRRLYIIGQLYHKNRRLRDIALKNSKNKFKEDELFYKVSKILKTSNEKEKQVTLPPRTKARLARVEKKTEAKKQPVVPAAYRTQVTILARHYTIIHVVAMKNGMKLVGSILRQNPNHLTLATVNGVHTLPRNEVVGLAELYRR